MDNSNLRCNKWRGLHLFLTTQTLSIPSITKHLNNKSAFIQDRRPSSLIILHFKDKLHRYRKFKPNNLTKLPSLLHSNLSLFHQRKHSKVICKSPAFSKSLPVRCKHLCRSLHLKHEPIRALWSRSRFPTRVKSSKPIVNSNLLKRRHPSCPHLSHSSSQESSSHHTPLKKKIHSKRLAKRYSIFKSNSTRPSAVDRQHDSHHQCQVDSSNSSISHNSYRIINNISDSP